MLKLSPTEDQVLRLYDAGASYKEIAVALERSPHTIKAHARRIVLKSQARSLRHAAHLRRRDGGCVPGENQNSSERHTG